MNLSFYIDAIYDKSPNMSITNTYPNPYGRSKFDLSSSCIPAKNKECFARDTLSKNTLEHIGINSTIFQETLQVHGKEAMRKGIYRRKWWTIFNFYKREIWTEGHHAPPWLRYTKKDFNNKAIELNIDKKNTLNVPEFDVSPPCDSTLRNLDKELVLIKN